MGGKRREVEVGFEVLEKQRFEARVEVMSGAEEAVADPEL